MASRTVACEARAVGEALVSHGQPALKRLGALPVGVGQHIAELPDDLRPPSDGGKPGGRLGRLIAEVDYRVLGEHLVEAVPLRGRRG